MPMKRERRYFLAIIVLCCLMLSVFFLSGCDKKKKASQDINSAKTSLTFTTEYQVVFLDNGQVFFGKLQHIDSPYLLLKDVYYIQQVANKKTKEVKNTLVKRGSEWHRPDIMYINANHIVLIEPVGQNSKVAQLIEESRVKRPIPYSDME